MTKGKTKTYDPKCFELAEHFLDEYKDRLQIRDYETLAHEIQVTCEDFVAEIEQMLQDEDQAIDGDAG
jgi:transcription initiation factor IIF auxiliary subunit